MIRGAAILLAIGFIFAASPHRTEETLRFGAARPTSAEAALATAILRGALADGGGKGAEIGASSMRTIRNVGP